MYKRQRLPVPPLGATTGHGLIHGALNKGPGSLDDEYYDDGTAAGGHSARSAFLPSIAQGNRSTASLGGASGDAPPGQGSKRRPSQNSIVVPKTEQAVKEMLM